MRLGLTLFLLYTLLMGAGGVYADGAADIPVDPEDAKIIAVLDELELMEIVNDLALFKDMEYIKEEELNESQD